MKHYLIIHPIRGLVVGVIPNQGFVCSRDAGVQQAFENAVFEVPLATDDYKEKFPLDSSGAILEFFETELSNMRDIWKNHPEIITKVGAERLVWVANERPI